MAITNVKKLEIKDNRIYGVTHDEGFNVLLHDGTNTSITPVVDFAGMPIETLIKLAFDTMKVKFRPHVKGLSEDVLRETFHKRTLSWREMITKEGASSKISLISKSSEEIAAEIKALQALLPNKTE